MEENFEESHGIILITLILELFVKIHFNDNMISVLLAGLAVLLVLPPAKFNFDILVLLERHILHSIAFSDASRCDAKKKMMKFG